jgi:hypothetical protein
VNPEEIDRFFAEYTDPGSLGGRRVLPSLDSLKFDTAGYEYRGHKNPGQDHIWSTPEGDLVVLIYCPGPPGFPENARSIHELRIASAAKFKAPGGQVVEEQVIRTISRPGIQVIFKTPRGNGWTYVGSLCVPFRDFGFVIQAISEERGMTGVREAMVMYLQNTVPESPKIPEPGPACPPWDPDNQRFDSIFPDHPLSRLRRTLKRVADSVEIDAATLQLPGFPLPQL